MFYGFNTRKILISAYNIVNFDLNKCQTYE